VQGSPFAPATPRRPRRPAGTGRGRRALLVALAAAGLAAGALGVLAGVTRARGGWLLAEADARIQHHRTREVVLRVLDAAGGPLAGAPVRLRMTRHAFRFGANLFLFDQLPTPGENARYLELFAGLFDTATVPFYLGLYEPEPGRTGEKWLDGMAAWAQAAGIRLKGHPLVWHSPMIVPAWLPAATAEVEAVHERRVREIVGHFRGRIGAWDVMNEPTLAWFYDNPVAAWEAELGVVEATRRALAWARAADPDALLLVNEVNVGPLLPAIPLALAHPLRALAAVRAPVPGHPFSFRAFLQDLLRAGGEFDAIGLQSHMHAGAWPLAWVWDTCEAFADLGRPLHWTELTVLSGSPKLIRPEDPGWKPEWPGTPEGERAQAEYVEQLYRLLFSHPAVESITWWDLSDRDAWLGAPAGLVRADLTPKPAYEELQKLIRGRWWTDVEARTDADGRVRLRGFCGDYALDSGGAAARFRIDCARPDGEVVEIRAR
jgi:GH35 family endo-1,4-beta-xylanase